MSVSETGGGVMASRDHHHFAGVQNSPATVQSAHMGGYAGDTAAVYPPFSGSPPPYTGADGGGVMAAEQMKRKRGRPRKYGPDGSMALGLNPAAAAGVDPPPVAGAPPPPGGVEAGPASPNSLKKPRGRPPGSGKKQQMDNLGSTGFGFTPHIITVTPGEDVASKIMSFSQHGPRAICVLSASGAISNVTLRQAATSGGTATYEGRFDILSLSGSFLLSEIGGQRSRTGGLSVALSGTDGRILGGCVAGVLTAASPVQVIVGSFVADGRKESKPADHFELSPTPMNSIPGGMTGANSPPSRGTLSESSGGPGSPLNQSAPVCTNNNLQGMSGMPWK